MPFPGSFQNSIDIVFRNPSKHFPGFSIICHKARRVTFTAWCNHLSNIPACNPSGAVNHILDGISVTCTKVDDITASAIYFLDIV